MTLVGQPPPSAALQKGFELLALGKAGEAGEVVRKAALEAKKLHGSGSHPLALAYADLARLHLRMGDTERAAREFQHAGNGPMPANPQHRRDRLSFLLGFGAALGDLGQLPDAEIVLRQCQSLAKKLDGANSALALITLVPLADVYLLMGKTAEATRIAETASDALWKLGDPLFAETVGTRAEVLKANGKADDAFTDLADLPDDLVSTAVASTLTRAGKGNIGRVRAVLSDLLGFVDKKFGDGHVLTCDTLAAVAHHEAAAGEKADVKIRKSAVRRSIWSYAVRRVPGGLLANLELEFEPDGAIHLAPHLTREPSSEESAQLATILNQAVDDLYSRPAIRP